MCVIGPGKLTTVCSDEHVLTQIERIFRNWDIQGPFCVMIPVALHRSAIRERWKPLAVLSADQSEE